MTRSTWTRKTYQMAAESIRTEVQFASDDSRYALTRVARNLANEFISDNPKFDRERFMDACGLGDH